MKIQLHPGPLCFNQHKEKKLFFHYPKKDRIYFPTFSQGFLDKFIKVTQQYLLMQLFVPVQNNGYLCEDQCCRA